MTSLTDRYVYAATRFVAAETERDELALELRERIADTIEDLSTGGLTHDAAEREALTELGDPLRLAADYRGRPMHLVGPRYYFTWLRILVPLLAIVPPIIGVIDALVAASTGDGIGEIIASGIGTAVTVALHVVFWTTLTFAMIERVAPDGTEASWTPDLLPAVPEARGGQRRADLIASLVFLTAMAVLLIWQHVGSPFFDGENRLPLLDPDLWPWWGTALLALLALEALHAVWVYRAGWSWLAAAVNIAISLAFGAAVVWLVLNDRLLNPAFVEHVDWDPSWIDSARPFAVGIVIVIVGWETIDVLLKTARSHRAVSG